MAICLECSKGEQLPAARSAPATSSHRSSTIPELHHKSTVLDESELTLGYGSLAIILALIPFGCLAIRRKQWKPASSAATLALAQELAHPNSSAWAWFVFAAVVHRWRGDLQAATREHAEATLG